jgi:thymidylate synthase
MSSLYTVEDTNLSSAWVKVLKRIVEGSGNEITPLLLSLTGFDESTDIREQLDLKLMQSKIGSVQTVSETIFPNSLYQLSGYNRDKLYDLYKKNLPRIKKIDKSNGKGTYFERLIAYNGNNNTKINQLEGIITSLRSNNVKRRSKLQASIFDPRIDHTNGAFQGFPCLQHVTCYISENGGLILNSFYAIQYLYRRGYGNWLGLINLGKFIAKELNIELERFNCYVGVEKLEVSKKTVKEILKNVG